MKFEDGGVMVVEKSIFIDCSGGVEAETPPPYITGKPRCEEGGGENIGNGGRCLIEKFAPPQLDT